jgi:hypothetical protein
VLDRNERIRVDLSVRADEPSLILRDADGRDRATLTLIKSEPSLFLWDKDGRALWSSPERQAR